jgi:hypothetical protein
VNDSIVFLSSFSPHIRDFSYDNLTTFFLHPRVQAAPTAAVNESHSLTVLIADVGAVVLIAKAPSTLVEVSLFPAITGPKTQQYVQNAH